MYENIKKHKDHVTLLTLRYGICLPFLIPDISIIDLDGVSLFVSFSPIRIRRKIKHNVFVKQNAPIMTNSKDGQGDKDKYLDTNIKFLSQEMLECI